MMEKESSLFVHRGNLRAALDASGVNCSLSAGNPIGTIIAAVDSTTALVAVGGALMRMTVRLASNASSYDPDKGTAFANTFEDLRCEKVEGHGTHRKPIVSVAYHASTQRVATIDGSGYAIVSTLDGKHKTIHLTPPPSPIGEPGWAGVALSPTQENVTATAMQFRQCINLYDGETCTRTFHTVHPITSLHFMSHDPELPPLVVATEGNQLSVWDSQMQEKAGCVARVMPCAGSLLASAVANNRVAVAGSDRIVYVYDGKKWSTLGAWKGALKFDVAHVFFSGGAEWPGDVCFAAAKVDGEFGCGSWSVKYEKTSRLDSSNFRADGRWIGMAQVPGKDDFFGVCASGTVYALIGATSLQPTAKKEQQGTKRPHTDHGPEGHRAKAKRMEDDD
eukprot:comp18163_c0_seq1/m.18945 comp18163_c0_seq1/g.18945  ORF comp18163_c0_seq1/g.18945 comp18163_c0_seq1/m.18945 type:complete len:392 (-) comp18163_c0_seq1:156-1331(-)